MSPVTSSKRGEEDSPGPEAEGCPHCGEMIESTFEFCPECNGYVEGELEADDEDDGGHEQSQVTYAGFAVVGVLSGFLSFGLFPVILGPVSILCGVQIFREHSEVVGLGMILLGALGTVVGFLVEPISVL